MGITQYQATVSDLRWLNERFLWLHVELLKPSRMLFVAGQHIILNIPGQDNKRQYSICSTPDIEHAFELVIDVSPGGVGSDYLAQIMPGDELSFYGPAGHFLVSPAPTEEKLLFVATGSGIAPFRSMIHDQLLNKQDSRQMSLYWGMRHAHDLFWIEDFEQLQADHVTFNFEITLSQPPEGWTLSQGYVTDLTSVHLTHPETTGVYLCGGGPMIESMTQLLRSMGVPEAHIHKERFF